MRTEDTELDAIDGVSVGAHVVHPDGDPLGCIVVAQEIFGVNAHIRQVCRDLAGEGYLAVAPRFFDRLEKGVELDYTAEDTARGRTLVDRLGMDAPLRDVRAAQKQVGRALPTAVMGFCWGGTVALLSSTRLGLAGISWYGGRSLPYLHEHAQAPLVMHFGSQDPLIPPEAVTRLRDAHPQAEVHVYEAGHGFNRAGHADHVPEAATLAMERSLAFLARVWDRGLAGDATLGRPDPLTPREPMGKRGA